MIYGDNKPPLTISVDYAELRQKIYAGRFLTTVYDLELDGQKHRVIPRDFQLDAVRDIRLVAHPDDDDRSLVRTAVLEDRADELVRQKRV